MLNVPNIFDELRAKTFLYDLKLKVTLVKFQESTAGKIMQHVGTTENRWFLIKIIENQYIASTISG